MSVNLHDSKAEYKQSITEQNMSITIEVSKIAEEPVTSKAANNGAVSANVNS